MKKTLAFILFCFFTQSASAQLMKSFDNEKEWRLSWKVLEFGTEEQDNKNCALCMDSILVITNAPDKRILDTGLKCYIKNGERNKAVTISQRLFQEGYISVCDGTTFSELFHQTCPKATISAPELQDRLIRLLICDQYYRSFGIGNALAKEGYTVHHDSLLRYNMSQLDAINQMELKAIFAQYGFPTKEMVGQWGIVSVRMVLQHSGRDIAFQKQYLPQIKALVDAGILEGKAYAYLLDRIAVNEGKPQVYGTQQVPDEIKSLINYQPMEAPELVNQRRMQLGMMPFEKYLQIHSRNTFEVH